MAGIRCPAEDADLFPSRPPPAGGGDLVSDDERSAAADSWSVNSDYGSTLDGDHRHGDAADTFSFRAASDYSSDKDVPDANEVETSDLGLQSYWNTTYADDLKNFHEHGHAGEVWFGVEAMDVITSWAANLCTKISVGSNVDVDSTSKSKSSDELCSWSVLDIGTGNGMLLQELAKQGFTDLTGTDFCEGAVELARNLAVRNGFSSINFLVDDILETKLERQFHLVMDKGTLDAVGLHPDGPVKRIMYWESVSKLVLPGGILVITSCNSSREELLQEMEDLNQRRLDSKDQKAENETPVFRYLDHVQTYPTAIYSGVEGSLVATVAFIRK